MRGGMREGMASARGSAIDTNVMFMLRACQGRARTLRTKTLSCSGTSELLTWLTISWSRRMRERCHANGVQPSRPNVISILLSISNGPRAAALDSVSAMRASR